MNRAGPADQPFGMEIRLSLYMKRNVLWLLLLLPATAVFSQKVDSIFFHLYTDSLKKGQFNYINVDGKMADGRWVPMTSKEISFSCPTATFEGNQLIIPEDFREEKVTVRAVLKSNPAIRIEKTIWIKKLPDPPLPGRNDLPASGKRKDKRN